MKTKEEIKLMGEKYATTHEDVSDRLGKYLVSACFQDGYIQCQCQEDMADKKYTEEDVINLMFMATRWDTFKDGAVEYGMDMDNFFKYLINSLNKQD